MNPEDWAALSTAFRILSPALGAYAIILLRQILSQLRTLNGRVTRIEVWQEEHEKHDLTHFAQIDASISRLDNHIEHQLRTA